MPVILKAARENYKDDKGLRRADVNLGNPSAFILLAEREIKNMLDAATH